MLGYSSEILHRLGGLVKSQSCILALGPSTGRPFVDRTAEALTYYDKRLAVAVGTAPVLWL